jgi:Fibrobacter succinogenes major domain (Fib_succ_major).
MKKHRTGRVSLPIVKLTAALGLAITLTACEEKEAAKAVVGTFTDSRDGKEYKTAKIGEQVWMAENLNYDVKCSGCYDKDPANCGKYGRLYDWGTARRACPKGWHLPSNEEWDILYKFVAGVESTESPSETAAKYLKAKSGWNNGNGEDKYGFSALPGGVEFSYVGDSARWWSDYGSYNPYGRITQYHFNDAYWPTPEGDNYFSIRCLQNGADYAAKEAEMAKEIEEEIAKEAAAKSKREKVKKGSFTDTRDGKKYKTVKLDKQTWMAENLNYEVKGSVCSGNEGDCNKWGRLYDKETAMKVCPNGWHLPSGKEWGTLYDFADGYNNLKAKSIWKENGDYVSRCLDTEEDFTDDYGFSALPGGWGTRENSTDDDGNSSYNFNFGGSGVGGNWWNSDSEGSYVGIYGNDGGWGASEFEWSYWGGEERPEDGNKTYLFGVRCVQN